MTVARGYYTRGRFGCGRNGSEGGEKSPGKVAIPINVWQEPLLTGTNSRGQPFVFAGMRFDCLMTVGVHKLSQHDAMAHVPGRCGHLAGLPSVRKSIVRSGTNNVVRRAVPGSVA
jgi:hypothetical protein